MVGILAMVAASAGLAAMELIPQFGQAAERAVFSPDDQLIATISDGGMVVIWDVETGHAIRDISTCGNGRIHSRRPEFSPDGALLAFPDGTALGLWDVKTGKRLRAFTVDERAWRPVFSRDWRWLALVGMEGKVAVWEVATGERRALIQAYADPDDAYALTGPPYLAFDSAGESLLTCDTDGELTWWDPATGDVQRVLELGGGSWTVRSSGDGRRLVRWGDGDPAGLLVELATGETVKAWPSADPISLGTYRGGFSPDGSKLFGTSGGRYATAGAIVDAETGALIAALEQLKIIVVQSAGALYGTAEAPFSPDGTLLASTKDMGKTLVIIDANTGAELRELGTFENDVRAAGFSPDGGVLVSTEKGGGTTLWEMGTGEPRLVLSAQERGQDQGPAFSHDGSRFVAWTPEDEWEVYDSRSFEAVAPLANRRHRVDGLRFDSQGLVTVLDSEAVVVWDPETLTPVLNCVSTLSQRDGLAFIHDAKWIDDRLMLAGWRWPNMYVWDAVTGEQPERLQPCGKGSLAPVWSPSGDLLAARSRPAGAGIWDAWTGMLLHVIDDGTDKSGHGVAFSPDGRVVATVSRDGLICQWDVETGEELARTETDGVYTYCAPVFAPDSSAVAVTARGGAPALIDSPVGLEVRRLDAPESAAETMAFSRDGRWLAGGGRDGSIVVWDVASGRMERVVREHEARVTALAFAPEGHVLASSSSDGTVRLWDTRTWELAVSLWPVRDHRVREQLDPEQASQAVEEYEWVAWTPEGFYDCSDGGEALIRFRDEEQVLHPAEEYAEELHRPDAVRERVRRPLVGE